MMRLMTRDPVADLVRRAHEAAVPVWRRGVRWMDDKRSVSGERDASGRPVANPGGVDLVTEGDLLVDGVIREGLAELFPGVPLVSEESDPREDGSEPPSDCFVLDPIDGTSNFASGLGLWAISLARVQDSVPVEAWLIEGGTGTLSVGRRGGEATRGGRPMRVTEAGPQVGLLSVALAPAVVPLVLASRNFLGVRCLGSHATALTWVADGLLGVHAGRGHPWDVAAGYVFLECAGGRVTTLDGGERPFWSRAQALAGAPHIVELCLEILANSDGMIRS